MIHYHGLTWNHPRGFHALRAASALPELARDGISLEWDVQPLEGFESGSLVELCRQYDLLVIDHPHLGHAVAEECLTAVDEVLAKEELDELEANTVGPSFASFRYEGRQWALPLDAATQVLCFRPDLLESDPPTTWDRVMALSHRHPTALSLAGPHAANTFYSIAVALGEPPFAREPTRLISSATGEQVLTIMADLYARMPPAALEMNPIAMLTDMANGSMITLCPLVYGYVAYAVTQSKTSNPLVFRDAPAATLGGRCGTTLGGTGLAFSQRCSFSPGLLRFVRWIVSSEAQAGFVPAHSGQPSRREAWQDRAVNRAAAGFYRNTIRSLEDAWVRPRMNGFVEFQNEASTLIRDGLALRRSPAFTLDRLQHCYDLHCQPSSNSHSHESPA